MRSVHCHRNPRVIARCDAKQDLDRIESLDLYNPSMLSALAKTPMNRPNEEFDPGASLYALVVGTDYLGGGLWVCFECFAKSLLGRKELPRCK